MSFGDAKLDRAFDNWVTQTPEDYFRENEEEKDYEIKKVGSIIDVIKNPDKYFCSICGLMFNTEEEADLCYDDHRGVGEC